MKKIKYKEMLPNEYLAAVEQLPVFMIPNGLVEWRTEHLPLRRDVLKVYGLRLKLPERLQRGIVLPPLHEGHPGFSSFVGTRLFRGLCQPYAARNYVPAGKGLVLR